MASECPVGHCGRCGKRGHSLFDCPEDVEDVSVATTATTAAFSSASTVEEVSMAMGGMDIAGDDDCNVSKAMGGMDTVDDDDCNSVCSYADVEAYTSVDMTTTEVDSGEYGFVTGTGGVEQSDGGEPWVLDTGATSHFTPDSSMMTDYRKCEDRVLRCAGGAVPTRSKAEVI